MSTANEKILDLLFAIPILTANTIRMGIHFYTKKLRKGLFKFLIRKGADVNARNNDGYGPLHMAVDAGLYY